MFFEFFAGGQFAGRCTKFTAEGTAVARQQQPSTEHPATCAGFAKSPGTVPFTKPFDARSPGTVPSTKPFERYEYTVPASYAADDVVLLPRPPEIPGILSVVDAVDRVVSAAAADGFQATSCFFVTSQRGKETEG